MSDTIHSIRRSARLFLSGTCLSRVAGMVRDISMAFAFGTQPAVAAFMVAFRFAHLLRRIFGEGAMQSAFIPEFEELRCQDEKRAFLFFRDLTAFISMVLSFIILLGSGILAACLYSGYFSPSHQEAMSLTLIMLPSLLFICLFGLNASLLQCERYYFTPSVAPVAFNVIWIITALYLRSLPAEQAMPLLSIGVVLACFSQWMMTMPQTVSTLKQAIHFPLWRQIKWTSTDMRRLLKPLALGILGVSASQINNAIDPLFAWHADAEGPALLWYAIRIQQLPLALFGVSIAGAILPPLSRAIKAGRREDYLQLLQFAFHRTWQLMLPLTAALFLMGDSCVSLLYGRGDFNSGSIIGTTHCLWAYGFGLLPAALIMVLAPACYAENRYKLTTIASFINLTLNIFLNSLFIFFFGWGAASVALATSLSAWTNLFFLSAYLTKNGTALFSNRFLQEGLAVSLATLIAIAGTYLLRWHVQNLPFFGEALLNPASLLERISLLSVQAGSFGGLFLMGMWIIRKILAGKAYFVIKEP